MALTKITTKLIEDSTITNADISASFVAGISGSFTQDMTLATASIAAITASVSSIRTDISTNLANMTLATASIAAITASVSTLKSNVGQALNTDSAVTFATVDTGQGANELYDMDQNVLTTSSPTFANTTVTGTLTATEVHTQFVSASITKTTGSNVFGDEPSDRHQFTGSAFISSSITAVTGSYGRVEATNYTGDGSSLTGIDIPTAAAISGSIVGGVSGSATSTGSFGKLIGEGGDITGITAPAITAIAGTAANQILTDDGDATVTSESGLTYDGSTLAVTGDQTLSGDLIMADGKGIDFAADASPAAGMTAEILDDYEEGTWSPVVSDPDGDNMTMNDGYDTGYYTKVGNLVTVSGRFLTTSTGAASGDVRIYGLPFTVANNEAAHSGGTAAKAAFMTITAGESVSYYGAKNTTYLQLMVWDATTGTTDMQVSEWQNGGQIVIGFSYRAA